MLEETPLRKIVSLLPALGLTQAQQQAVSIAEKILSDGHPIEALAVLRRADLIKRSSALAHSARRLAQQGEEMALDLALSWMDAIKPGWATDADEIEHQAALLAQAAGSSTETMACVLAHGVAPLAQSHGRTALRAAVSGGVDANVKMLLKLGVEDRGYDSDGLGLLHLAAQQTNPRTIIFLVDAGYHVNALDQTSKPRTALGHAINQTQNRSVTSVLLASGANADIPEADNKGQPHPQSGRGALLNMLGTMHDEYAHWALAEIEAARLERQTGQAEGEGRRPDRL